MILNQTGGVMYEIGNMALYRLCRDHSICDCRRRRDLSVVWPAGPTIPTDYDREVRQVFARADAANFSSTQVFAAELNAQRITNETG